MKNKISSKWLLVIFTILGIVVSSKFLSFSEALSDQQQVEGLIDTKSVASIENVTFSPLSVGKPIGFKIPKIKVDSRLERVGLTPQGAVDVPKGPTSAAWFELGARPGEEGTAVIVGHFGWKNGIPAVFDNLHKLNKGDKLYVEDDAGGIITFVVRELRSYKDNEIAPDVFGSNDGKAHLNLITCQGVWNKTKKSYSNRLVVFTDKVDSTSSPQRND